MPNIGVQYEVRLSKSSQYFYLLRDKDIRLKTVYNPHRIWNYAEDKDENIKID